MRTPRTRRSIGRAVMQPAAFKDTTTEHSWQLTVLELAATLGWHRHFTPDWMWKAAKDAMAASPSKRRYVTARGWPDLVLWHEIQGRTLYAELKAAKGTLSDDQKQHLTSLARAGNECYVWRPKDGDAVETILRGMVGTTWLDHGRWTSDQWV